LILAVKISRVVYMKGIYPDNGLFLLKTKSKEKTVMIEEYANRWNKIVTVLMKYLCA
jgi:hypothetical protein